jgi:ferrochelatase
VAEAAAVRRWSFAYQSAGRTAEPWLGPDVLEVLAELAEAGETGVVVQSIGFVADHLEILYDLDIEVRDGARRLGLAYSRTGMPNAHPDFIAALAGLVVTRLGAPAEGAS